MSGNSTKPSMSMRYPVPAACFACLSRPAVVVGVASVTFLPSDCCAHFRQWDVSNDGMLQPYEFAMSLVTFAPSVRRHLLQLLPSAHLPHTPTSTPCHLSHTGSKVHTVGSCRRIENHEGKASAALGG